MTINYRKLLVVDDDQSVLDAYQDILADSDFSGVMELMEMLPTESAAASLLESSPAGFELVEANSAEEAIERFSTAHSEGDPFAAVFLDVRMPPGMDGIDCAAELRKIDPQVRLAIVSAYADYSIEAIREKLGRDFIYLKKPFIPEELSQVAELYSCYLQRSIEGKCDTN